MLVGKPFAVPVEEACDDLQDKLDLKKDSTCKDMFDTLSICEFWAKMGAFYRCVAVCVTKECITKLLPFISTYL